MKNSLAKWLVTLCCLTTMTQISAQKVNVVSKPGERKVDILVDGKPFTSYIYPSDSVLKKPVLFPVYTPQGTMVTRGYPMMPRAGERVDHPHHVGIWLNYESVNGNDFWNNSTAIKDRSKYGTIKHKAILKTKSGKGKGSLSVSADWYLSDGKGKHVLVEKTDFDFFARQNLRIIDRSTTLTAQGDTVYFKDVKDGFFAIRLARELEHPSNTADNFVDANGIVTRVEKMDNTNITGNYRSSEGIEGEKVWSTRGKWMNLSGRIGNEDIAVCIIDHPQNLKYPTYWHARGYGLFAANPLGAKIFSNGKDELNLKLAPGQSVTFKYRVVVATGKLSDEVINGLAKEFGGK